MRTRVFPAHAGLIPTKGQVKKEPLNVFPAHAGLIPGSIRPEMNV